MFFSPFLIFWILLKFLWFIKSGKIFWGVLNTSRRHLYAIDATQLHRKSNTYTELIVRIMVEFTNRALGEYYRFVMKLGEM